MQVALGAYAGSGVDVQVQVVTQVISFRPGVDAVRKAIGLRLEDIEASAVERWEISPAEMRWIGPAKFLPGQLDRIGDVAFGSFETIVRDLRGDFESMQEATLGFRFREVDLVDGVLYLPGSRRHLRQRRRRMPFHLDPTEVVSGALYESWIGNRWFGNWLLNDCLTYRLAECYGSPVSTTARLSGHGPRYENLLGMNPKHVENVHFDELTLFRDFSHNSGTKLRADDFRKRMAKQIPFESHAGTFILRGQDGAKRVLVNENALAEHLAANRGFRIIDPLKMSVDEIVSACAGARVVGGVEGSHLVHGLMVMPSDASLLVIQPPRRVVSVLKANTDRQGQTFSFVVATGGEDEFTVDFSDVDRTLDLLAG